MMKTVVFLHILSIWGLLGLIWVSIQAGGAQNSYFRGLWGCFWASFWSPWVPFGTASGQFGVARAPFWTTLGVFRTFYVPWSTERLEKVTKKAPGAVSREVLSASGINCRMILPCFGSILGLISEGVVHSFSSKL